MRDHGLHFIKSVKTAHLLLTKQTLIDECPSEHGQFVVYRAVFKGHVMYALGIRKGGKRVRCIIATFVTTLPAVDQCWSGYDEQGCRYHVIKPQCDIDKMWSTAQPGVDMHNLHRQNMIACEKKWLTNAYEQRSKAAAHGTIATDAYGMC